ncbi:LacI family DNA-binding transcriptional regulator [Lentzea sp. NPDC051838]|uniref:LacI family DNA-binding transcriptional regulator n=1 Tax=Lentzea sp. NPDC051838 TaxID=3154849 RepID=UPI00344591DA
MKVGITEIAALAGVSEATVSRVINRRKGVAQATREAVEHAMDELGYERTTPSRLVAVITERVSNPFFADLAERIETILAPHGLKLIVCPAFAGGVQEREFVAELADRGIGACVFLSASNTLDDADPETFSILRTRRIPFIAVNGAVPGHDIPVFSTDDVLAASLAVDHLHRLGHRRIAMVSGPKGNGPADRRVRGFVEAMEKVLGIDAADWVIRQPYTVEGGQAAAAHVVRAGATAVVAASDFLALGVIRGARRHGLTIPDDLSVVGYDGTMITEFVDPPLTTVRQPSDRIAAQVGHTLLALLNNRDVPTGELLFDPELIIRATTAPPR